MGTGNGSSRWIAQAIRRLVIEAPENRLRDFGGQPIFGEPLVGVADADDPLFARFRAVVDASHLHPRHLLEQHATGDADLTHIRVVAWALPFAEPIRRSNRVEGWPSQLYSAARNNGGALNYAVRHRLTQLLLQLGHVAIAPVLSEDYEAFRSDAYVFSSSWSERHVACAAGLGLFGLNGALITPLGANVRLGSVVTNLPFTPTPRPGEGHRAPCLVSEGTACGKCIARCPVGAISAAGLDKTACYAMRQAVRERCMDIYAETLHLLPAPIATRGSKKRGYSLGCALCQCRVPCESRFPSFATVTRDSAHA